MEHFGSPWSLEVPSLAEGQSKDVSDLSKASNDSLPSTSHPMVSRPGPPIRRASCDLFECLEAHERLPETTSRYVFKQLADAVCHLHRNGIVHCDLKVSESMHLQ